MSFDEAWRFFLGRSDPLENFFASLPVNRAETYLAHVTIGSVKGENDPGLLREALIPLREVELGKQRVSEATLCLIPLSRTTVLSPWEVVGSVPLA